jgi:hypothetical protein
MRSNLPFPRGLATRSSQEDELKRAATGELFVPRQTNTGLYVQLHEAGHPTKDILRVQEAYRLSCRLFNGRYRKTERAFICHAVGVGSATARFDRRIEIIIAAMLHAAYDSGQFPDGRTGRASDAHRQWLKEQVGSGIEDVVARYRGFNFEEGVPERLAATPNRAGDEDLLLIALAHEVDDLADGGLAFSPKYGRSIASRVAACATLARSIDQDRLAETIEEHGSRYETLGWIDELGERQLEGFRVAPNLRGYWRLRRDYRRGKGVDII